MDYRSKNHSKYLIMYHIIFVCNSWSILKDAPFFCKCFIKNLEKQLKSEGICQVMGEKANEVIERFPLCNSMLGNRLKYEGLIIIIDGLNENYKRVKKEQED